MPATSTTPGIALDALPKPATAIPSSEKTGGAMGVSETYFAREDHQHPRLTSTTYATLDSVGQAVVAFTRPFANKPGVVLTETDANVNDQPLVTRVVGWTRDASGNYIGCTIKGSRAQILPTVVAVSGILTAVITGVNALVSALTNFNVFGGMAVGATVSVIAVARSDVASN